MLENALVVWAMNKVCKEHAFTPVTTPELAHINLVEACGFQPRDDSSQVYQLDNKRDCLIGTSEIPLAGMYSNEILDCSMLPHKMIAHSHCFRKEAGSGNHSKGLYRLHQFSKVEMFALTRGDVKESDSVLMEMLGVQEDLLRQLGLSYRVLNMATRELGAAAYRKFDIEAWMPSRNEYGEVSSTSNCTSYQAKRLNIQYFDEQN